MDRKNEQLPGIHPLPEDREIVEEIRSEVARLREDPELETVQVVSDAEQEPEETAEQVMPVASPAEVRPFPETAPEIPPVYTMTSEAKPEQPESADAPEVTAEPEPPVQEAPIPEASAQWMPEEPEAKLSRAEKKRLRKEQKLSRKERKFAEEAPDDDIYAGVRIRSYDEIRKEMEAEQAAAGEPEQSEPTSSFTYLFDDTQGIPLSFADQIDNMKRQRIERAEQAVADAIESDAKTASLIDTSRTFAAEMERQPELAEDDSAIVIDGFDYQAWRRSTQSFPKITDEDLQKAAAEQTAAESAAEESVPEAPAQETVQPEPAPMPIIEEAPADHDDAVLEIEALMEAAMATTEDLAAEAPAETAAPVIEFTPLTLDSLEEYENLPEPEPEELPSDEPELSIAELSAMADAPAVTTDTIEPEAPAAEEPIAAPEAQADPAPETVPEAPVQPEPEPEPETPVYGKAFSISADGDFAAAIAAAIAKAEEKEPTPAPEAAPVPEVQAEPAAEPAPETPDEPVIEPAPEIPAEPAAEPAPEIPTEPVVEPEPETPAEPETEVIPEVQPEVVPEPEPEPKPVPHYIPVADPERYRFNSLPVQTFRLEESTDIFSAALATYYAPPKAKPAPAPKAQPAPAVENTEDDKASIARAIRESVAAVLHKDEKKTAVADTAPAAEPETDAPAAEPETPTEPEAAPAAPEAPADTAATPEPEAAPAIEAEPEEPLPPEISALLPPDAPEELPAEPETAAEAPAAPEMPEAQTETEPAPAVPEQPAEEEIPTEPAPEQNEPAAPKFPFIPDFHKKEKKEKKVKEKPAPTNPEEEEYEPGSDPSRISKEIKTSIRELQLRTIVTGVFTAALMGLGLICEKFIPHSVSQIPYLVLNLAFLLIPAAICYKTIWNGIKALRTFHGNTDSGIAVAVLASIIQGIALFFDPHMLASYAIHFYGSIAVGALLLNSIGKLIMMNRISRNFVFVSSAENKYAVEAYEDINTAIQLAKGVVTEAPQIMHQHKTRSLRNFLQNSYESDPSMRTSQLVAPIALVASVVLGIVTAIITGNVIAGLTALSLATCISAPIASLLCVNLPVANLCKLAHRHGAMLVGYSTVEKLSHSNAVMVDSDDLFPKDSVTLADFKSYTARNVDPSIYDAAAVLSNVGGTMRDLFEGVIASQKEMLPKAADVTYVDGFGMTGTVSGKQVLVGTLEFMLQNDIMVPMADREPALQKNQRVIFLAENNELKARLIVTYEADIKVVHEMQRLEHSGISVIVRALDPNLTPAFLAGQFHIDERYIKVLPQELGDVCDQALNLETESSEAQLATRGKTFSMLRMISACVQQKHNISVSITLQIVSVILGFVLVAFLSCYAGLQQLSTLAILIYEAVWTAAIIIIPKLRKP